MNESKLLWYLLVWRVSTQPARWEYYESSDAAGMGSSSGDAEAENRKRIIENYAISDYILKVVFHDKNECAL